LNELVEKLSIFVYTKTVNKKIVNKTNSLDFNGTCLKEQLLPTYTYKNSNRQLSGIHATNFKLLDLRIIKEDNIQDYTLYI
jgi:hypothetical protein